MRRALLGLLLTALAVGGADAQFEPRFSAPSKTSSAIQFGAAGVATLFSKTSIPVILSSTGSMANNGALSSITALPATYANAYIALPSGAIASGVPASTDIYYVQMSSTSAGTVCNNRLADNLDANGAPKIPASCTAFATTGPGAFTGVTGAVTLVTLTLPANVMGANGILDLVATYTYNNSANNKLTTVAFGATNIVSANEASTSIGIVTGRVSNRGATNAQTISGSVNTGSGINGSGAALYGTVDTTATVSIAFSATHGTATDNAILEGFSIYITR